MDNNNLDWDAAEKHLTETIDEYAELIKMQNANPFLGLGMMKQLLTRYQKGERTQELFDDMMSVE